MDMNHDLPPGRECPEMKDWAAKHADSVRSEIAKLDRLKMESEVAAYRIVVTNPSRLT